LWNVWLLLDVQEEKIYCQVANAIEAGKPIFDQMLFSKVWFIKDI
jgi:hypothetical protein